MARYTLRANNAAVRETCPVCGTDFRPAGWAWPFVPGTFSPLCSDCATEDVTTIVERAELAAELAPYLAGDA